MQNSCRYLSSSNALRSTAEAVLVHRLTAYHSAYRCFASSTLRTAAARGGSLPSPPPLGVLAAGRSGTAATASRLPPPPPLVSSRLQPSQNARSALGQSPQELLSTFIAYIPTYFVPLQCIAAILPDEIREPFVGRGKLLNFLRRYSFYFEVRTFEGFSGRFEVRLREDVSHPQRGSADEKFMMTDVGETTSYVAKPEYIVCTENIEYGSQNVLLKPPAPPPSVRVRLEERVPVVERLKSLVPSHFAPIETLEETIPEDVLLHPYFDCQGGLLSIARKLPEELQVVGSRIRRRPAHLAPLALDEYTLEASPLPDVAALLKRDVCSSDIPHWVSITSLYEQLTREQKTELKLKFRSFAGFLRSHGRSLAVSTDMLQVSMWICKDPPPLQQPDETVGVTTANKTSTAEENHAKELTPPSRPVAYSPMQVLNALYDAFPPHQTLSLRDAFRLLPPEMATSPLPRKLAPWLASFPLYFTVENADVGDAGEVLLRRASDRQPLDLAAAIYDHLPGEAAREAEVVVAELSSSMREIIQQIGIEQLTVLLPQWLEVRRQTSLPSAGPGGSQLMVRRLQSRETLQEAMEKELWKRERAAKRTADASLSPDE